MNRTKIIYTLVCTIYALLSINITAYGQFEDIKVDFNPTKSFLSTHPEYFHGDYIYIGNTNTKLISTDNPDSPNEEVENIMHIGGDGATIFNSSSASFCFEIKDWCKSDSIAFAQLIWCGKSRSTDKDKVKWQLNEKGYNEVSGTLRTINGATDERTGENFYSCVADITKELQKILFIDDPNNTIKNKEITFTVANIQTELTEGNNKFSGWNLLIIYKQKENKLRDIYVYNDAVFGAAGQYPFVGNKIEINYDLPNSYTGIGNYMISMTTAGGFKNNIDNETFYAEKTKPFKTIGLFSNSITISSDDTLNCEIYNEKEYSRGIDIHTINIPNVQTIPRKNWSFINKGLKNIYLEIPGENEHHYVLNTVISTNTPKNPEIEAVLEANNGSNPSCINYSMDINTGDNVERLNEFKIEIQLPDYTTSVSNFNIISNFSLDNPKIDLKSKSKHYIGVNTDKSYSTSQTNSDGWIKIPNDNNNLNNTELTELNNQLRKSVGEHPTLKIQYADTISNYLKNQRILRFEYEVCVDSSYYALNSMMTGKRPEIISQADLSVVGDITQKRNKSFSNDKESLLGKLNPCEEYYDLGSGEDFGGDGGNNDDTPDGDGMRNGKPTSINIDIEVGCPELPQDVEILTCADSCFSIDSIKSVLKKMSNNKFDLDTIVKREKEMWKKIKRDSLIKICQLAIPTKTLTLNNTVYVDSSNWYLMHKYWHKFDDVKSFSANDSLDLLKFYKDTCGLDEITITQKIFPRIRPIIDIPETTTYLDYKLQSTNSDWVDADGNYCVPAIEGTYQIDLVCPYNTSLASISTCSKSINVAIKVSDVPHPIISLLNEEEYKSGDTIKYCLDEVVKKIKIEKTTSSNELITDKRGDTTILDNNTLHWLPKITTNNELLDSFYFAQKTNGGCIGEPFKLYIKVLDIRVDETPSIMNDTILCISDNPDSITVKLTNYADVEAKKLIGFNLRWYYIGEKDSIIKENVDSIKLSTNSVGKFNIGVVYYYQECESDTAIFTLEVKPLPKKLLTPEISFCQYLTPDSVFIASNIIKQDDTDHIHWYSAKEANFTLEDTASLSSLLEKFDYSVAGKKEIVVAPISKFGCMGDTTLIPINIKNTDSTATRFYKDTIMLCEGIRPISLDSNIIKTGYENKHNWFWYQDKNTYLHNSLTGLVNNANKYDATPLYNTEFSMQKEYYVVRLDSLTMCASRPAKVTVIVSDSINSKPLIGDTTTFDYDNLLKIESYCINAPNYWQTLPFKASTDGLTIEYTKKQDLNDNCDSLWENKKKVLNKGGIPLPSEPGNTLYCIREVTSQNCAGPWVDLRISVRPAVEIEPLIDTFKICQFDKDVKLSEKDIKNNDGYIVYFFDADKKQIENPTLLNFNTDISGKFLSTLNNNFFYVSFYDGNKDCQSNLVAVDAIIHPKPSLPIIEEENKNLYFCPSNENICINDYAHVSVNPNDLHTKLSWDIDSILITENTLAKNKVHVWQIDTTTQCKSEQIEIDYVVEKPYKYVKTDSIKVCHNESVDLWNSIKRNIIIDNTYIKNVNTEFAIYSMIGNTRQKKLSQNETENISAKMVATEDEINDFLVEVWEPISGCKILDSVHIKFLALPKLDPIAQDTFCQKEIFNLPTPLTAYHFEWKDLDGNFIKEWINLQLMNNKTFRLTATTKDDYQCKDSIDWSVKIVEIPEVPIISDTNFCQNTGRHNIDYKLQSTISNPESDLILKWFKNDVPVDDVNTDTTFSTNIIQEKYKAVVSNLSTQCFNSKEIIVSTWQKISLNMEDIAPVCEPETINVASKINDYIKNAHLFGGNTPKFSSCFMIENGVEKQMNINNLSAIEFDSNNIEREFGYKMSDSKGVCTSADTFKVIINPKPSIPTIEGGQDTLFYCIDDAPFSLTAQPNGILKNVGLFWENGVKGNVTPINEGLRTATYGVQAIDTITQCKGDFANIVTAIAPSIKIKPIQGKDTIELCADETINLWDLGYKSFSQDGFYDSELIVTQVTKNGNIITQPLLEQVTSTQQDTSLYQFEVMDPISGCTALNKVVVIFHANPTIKFDGETTICQNLDLALSTIGDERLLSYKWEIDNMIVSTGKEYQKENLQENFSISLTTSLDELKSCSSVITKEIIVNPSPTKLLDTVYYICQTENEKIVKINRNRTSDAIAQYAISWFNTDGTIYSQEEDIEVDLSQSRILEYDVMLTNRTTSCNSEKSRVTIKINPRIRFDWSDPDTICPPNEYQLLQNVLNSVTGGTNPKYQYTLFNGDTIENENNISQSGRYTVFFKDDNQCENSQVVNVQFFKRPEVPTLIAQDIVCQGIGDITFAAKKNGEDVLNQTFEWKEGNKTTLADQLSVSTDEYGIRNFSITAVDTLSRCRSEESNFKLDIREKIKFSPIEPLESCHDIPVDLTLATQNAYSGNDEEKILSYFSVNSNNSLSLINEPTRVLNSGKVVVTAKESESGCYREDTIIVDIKEPLQIGAVGTTTICERNEIDDLTAINADRYKWVHQNGTEVESTLFPFGNSLTQTESFRLYGEKKVGNIYCMDSTDVEIIVNLNPNKLADSTLIYCQTTNGKKELNFSTLNREGEVLEIIWLTKTGEKLFSENENQTIEISNDTIYSIYAKQINSITGCEGDLATITINVLPKIEVPTIDSTTCQPNIINLTSLGAKGVGAKEHTAEIIIEKIEITDEIDRSIVRPIENAFQIAESGIYRVYYNYTFEDVTCRNTTDAKLTFLSQPQKPNIANQTFCQNTGDIELEGTPSLKNLRLIWEDLSVYPSRIDTNTTTISTQLATDMKIKVRHIQDNSGCISEDTIIRVTILPELIAMDLDTSICYGENVNLREMVENNHRNNSLIKNIQFKNLDGMQFDERKVESTSRFSAYFSDALGVCRDTSLVQINVNDPIEIMLEGDNPTICAQEVIQITASGADSYKWNDINEGATFTLKTTTPQNMLIKLNAKQAFNEIFCYKDSTISIEVMPAVEPLTLTYDTCRNSRITTDMIKGKFNISENIDSVWFYDASIRRDNINKVLEDEGNYQILATNQHGCKAIHNMKVNLYSAGKLAIENDYSKLYCYNDTITFRATSENESKFSWKNSDDNNILYKGNYYMDTLKANTNLTLIASEVVMGCKDSISFTINVREQTPIKVNVLTEKGETDICKGDTIKLAVTGLDSVFWLYNDTIIDSNYLEIIGEKNTSINVWGKDINKCQTKTDTVKINVATLFKPIIKTIGSAGEYDLSKEKNEIHLYEDGNVNDGYLTYQWQIGNEIITSTDNEFSHKFRDEMIHINKDIEVNLTVEHKFGCKASASKILTIDPYIYVPNTLLYGHGIIFMEDYDLQIFDRVGTLIYEGKGWDGTYKGKPAIADTYFYSLMYYIKGEKQFKTGYITLVR